MGFARPVKAELLFLTAALLSCTISILVLAACSGGPASSVLDTPDPSLDMCIVDSDCTLAIRVDVCCACPEVTTVKRVSVTSGVEQYIAGRDYSEALPSLCANVDCAPCPLPPAGAICAPAGICQAPESIQDILKICPECYTQAAQAAYQEGNLGQATSLCSQSGLVIDTCFSQLFELAITMNEPQDAESLCVQLQRNNYNDCLLRLAPAWALLDTQKAISLCQEIDTSDSSPFKCIVDVARAVKPQDQEKALKICDILSSDLIQLCREDVLR